MPHLVAHLSLWRILPSGDSEPAHDLLYGTLVCSAHRLRDMTGRLGVFFVFPDVSVRQSGTYYLGINLVDLMR
jgi:hypothetical protein